MLVYLERVVLQPDRWKSRILVITQFKKVSRETGMPFYGSEPGNWLHIDGGKH